MPECYLASNDPVSPRRIPITRLVPGARAFGPFATLAACTTLGNPPAADAGAGEGLLATSQAKSDLAWRGDHQASRRPAGLQYARDRLRRSRPQRSSARRFNKAISLDPNYAQAYANRALIYRKTNRLDLALADDDKALTIAADYAPAYVGRGIVYRAQGHATEALADFNKAITLKPDNADAYYNRGLLYQSRQQHQFAIDDFSAAVGLQNGNPEPWIARALSYLAIGDDKSAASDLDEAVQLDPQNARAWSSRG